MLFDTKSDANYCADPVSADTYAKRIKVAAQFCAERHSIYLKKAKGLNAPWSKDPVLRSYRFCNIYRELDKVTVQIMNQWINPNLHHPYLPVLALIGRVINHPPTLSALLSAGIDFKTKPNAAKTWSVFDSIRKSGEKLVTGAYIVNTIFPKDAPRIDGSKADYLANFLIPLAWEMRKELNAGLDSGSFRQTIDAFKKVHGIGAFIGNQAAVDLTYTKWLKKAPDIDTVWNPGPGTCQGINWISGFDVRRGKKESEEGRLRGGSADMEDALSQYLHDVNKLIAKHKTFTGDMNTGLAILSGPDASNSLCELSKYVGMMTGARERLKNTYRGF